MSKEVKKVGTGMTERDAVEYSGEDMAPALKELTEEWAEVGNSFEWRISRAEQWAEAVMSQADEPAFTEDNPQWYAQRILKHVRVIRRMLDQGDTIEAAAWSVDVGFLICEAAMKFRWQDDVDTAQRYKAGQAEKSAKANNKRWSQNEAHGELMRIVADLARKRDALGDYLPPSGLWGPLYSMMDDAGLYPNDRTDNQYGYEGDGGKPLTYEAFRKQVGRIRNND